MTIASPAGTSHSAAIEALKAELGDKIVLDEDVRRQFETDYGMFVRRMPGAVARCTSTEDVATVVRHCREHGVPVVGRGQGHTQSGQSTTEGGVTIDTAGLNQIEEVTDEYAVVGGGLTWRDFVAHVVPKGLVPPTLTNNLGVTVAGTTSVAGLGVASYRYGAQSDTVQAMEVVTGTGEVVWCSREENRDLFDVVRSGLSQFGIITRVKAALRRCKPKVRKYYLLYDDLGALMRDAKKVMDPDNDTFHTLESWCTPCFQGARKIGDGMKLGEGMQTFAYWMYPLHLTIEFEPGEEPDDEAVLEGLEPYKMLDICDFTQHEFCERLLPLFELWDRSGYSDMPHPWMETILPWDKAQEYIETVLSQTPPQALGPGGHILLWPCRTEASDAPLFKYPEGDLVMGWGLLPAVPPDLLEQALARLDMASELSIQGYDAKRYLSGYITFDTPEKWAAHYGDEWERVVAAKRKYDPDHILAPSTIQYPEDGES